MKSIAFLGTGLMGEPMARRLVAAGLPVAVWNRTESKAKGVVDAGARWAQSPAAAVAGATVVVSMLTDGRAFDAAVWETGAADAIARGAVVIDMSTTSPSVAREQAARFAARGVEYVDAPVSGGTRGAAAGSLAIMAGGDVSVIERLAKVFEPMGRCKRVGPVGAGQLCKLANQLIVAVTIGAVAEALVMAEKGGADPAAVRDALSGGFADSRILSEHGKRMIARDFVPGGAVHNQIKDLDAAVAFAKSSGFSLPLLTRVQELFHQLRAHGGGGLDHSALFLEIERIASAS